MRGLQQLAARRLAALGSMPVRSAADFRADLARLLNTLEAGTILTELPAVAGNPRFLLTHASAWCMQRLSAALRRRAGAGLGIVAVGTVGVGTSRTVTFDRVFWSKWYGL